MESLVNANTHFGLDLFQMLNKHDPKGSIFFSGFNISSALAMVLLRSKGITAAQLSKAFHFDEAEDLHSRFQALSSEMNSSSPYYVLKMASRLFGEKTCFFLQDFLTRTHNMYGAELSSVDFLNAPNSAQNHINQWAEEQTEGGMFGLLLLDNRRSAFYFINTRRTPIDNRH